MGKSATAKTNVVLVDAVRTPFGKAGSLYAQTRADDIMVRCIRGLLERNPNIPLDQIDDVAIAAATQTGDQGMNIGRSVSILSGIPNTVPGYSIDRWCAGALTAVTTIAGSINMGAYDLAIAGGVEHERLFDQFGYGWRAERIATATEASRENKDSDREVKTTGIRAPTTTPAQAA